MLNETPTSRRASHRSTTRLSAPTALAAINFESDLMIEPFLAQESSKLGMGQSNLESCRRLNSQDFQTFLKNVPESRRRTLRQFATNSSHRSCKVQEVALKTFPSRRTF